MSGGGATGGVKDGFHRHCEKHVKGHYSFYWLSRDLRHLGNKSYQKIFAVIKLGGMSKLQIQTPHHKTKKEAAPGEAFIEDSDVFHTWINNKEAENSVPAVI